MTLGGGGSQWEDVWVWEDDRRGMGVPVSLRVGMAGGGV